MVTTRRSQVNSHETLPSPARSSTGDIDIPLDLTVEILKKLPGKSLVRFRCVSKLWSSIISRRRDFIESIVARSRTQPPSDAHLIFEHMFPGTTTSELSLVFSSTTCPIDTSTQLLGTPGRVYQYVRGLILCWSEYGRKGIVYNPTTRQAFELPERKTWGLGSCLFGYDPLGNQYKVLFLPQLSMVQACQVFTLGDPTEKQWRPLQGVESHLCSSAESADFAVCINGAIYFISSHYASRYKLMRFDVRSEDLDHVDAPQTLLHRHTYLINYQGKLGFVCFVDGVEIWVREEKSITQGWSKIFFYDGMGGFEYWRISGVTRHGEIVFVDLRDPPAYHIRVLNYDPKRNCVRVVDLYANSPNSGLFRIMSRTLCV